MDDPTLSPVSLGLSLVFVLLVGASVRAWLLIARRWFRGEPLVPYESRRQVPWGGAEVVLVFVVFEFPMLLGLFSALVGGGEASEPPARGAAEEVDSEHPIVDLLSADPSADTWLLCIMVAVVIAPAIEEFTYRLVLLGWLEADERRLRRRAPVLRRLAPGVLPVVLVSLLFAMRHFRWAAPSLKPDQLRAMLFIQALWSLVTLGFGVWVLRARSGATAADFGVVPSKFAADVGLGLVTFAAVTAPVLGLQLVLRLLLPADFAVDPIPLFFLALALGLTYYRTHRIVPAVTAHMAFNATGMILAWLQL